jgi:hypothetical protein
MSTELTPDRIAAIKAAKRIGSKIAKEYPHISNDYRNGMHQKDIVSKYGFVELYGASPNVALVSVYYALSELIPKSEMKQLETIHRKANAQLYGLASHNREELSEMCKRNGRNNGKRAFRLGSGIFAPENQEKVADGSRRGRQKVNELGLGIHSLTSEQLSAAGKKGGKKAVEEKKGIHGCDAEKRSALGKMASAAAGNSIWSDEERAYFMELCENSAYQWGSGRRKGYPNYTKIAAALREEFGTERTPHSLGSWRYTLKGKKGKR